MAPFNLVQPFNSASWWRPKVKSTYWNIPKTFPSHSRTLKPSAQTIYEVFNLHIHNSSQRKYLKPKRKALVAPFPRKSIPKPQQTLSLFHINIWAGLNSLPVAWYCTAASKNDYWANLHGRSNEWKLKTLAVEFYCSIRQHVTTCLKRDIWSLWQGSHFSFHNINFTIRLAKVK